MVIGCTGHQDLPEEVAAYARAELGRMLDSQARVCGVCSLADGADQLFAEVVLACGGELRVVVPSSGYEGSFETEAGLNRYRALMQKAAAIEQLDFAEPSEEAYFAAGQKVVDLCDRMIALWDGNAARGHGGTADVVTYAERQGKPVQVLWVKGVRRG